MILDESRWGTDVGLNMFRPTDEREEYVGLSVSVGVP